MFEDEITRKINMQNLRSSDKWLVVLAWILIFMGIIMFFTGANAKDCIPLKEANKKVRQNQELISKLVYENRMLLMALKEKRKNYYYAKSYRSLPIFKTD